MADVVSPSIRSRMMAGIKGKNTKPELIVRKGLHRLGFRFRLHGNSLPGKPDLVFQKHRAVILVNGCFWHGHDCALFKWPTTKVDFWRDKIGQNKARDARNRERLGELGWRQLTVWECALKGRDRHPEEDVLSGCAEWLLTTEHDGEIAGNAEGISV